MTRPASEPLGPSAVGRRVVVRRRLPPGSTAGATDLVGVLVAADAGAVTLATQGGRLTIPYPDVLLARIVPDQTVANRDVRLLEEVGARCWVAPEHERREAWVLRAADGWSYRGNAALALADPAGDLEDELAQVRDWYAARSLPPTIQLPERIAPRLAAALPRLGWRPVVTVAVLTAPSPLIMEKSGGPGPDVPESFMIDGYEAHIGDQPDERWLGVYRNGDGVRVPAARHILTKAPGMRLAFARVDAGGRTVAVARGCLGPDPRGRAWLGVGCVEVDPAHRRRGLGTAVVAALARWAGDATIHLQVERDNVAALTAYRGLGFTEHHAYAHWRPSTLR